jgi:hypothetical protein
MSVDEIHWHDAVILGVSIDPEKSILRLKVDYPINWEDELYEHREIVFTDAYGYQEHEGPFVGCPTILSASVSSAGQFFLVRMETNAGYREVGCSTVELSPCACG